MIRPISIARHNDLGDVQRWLDVFPTAAYSTDADGRINGWNRRMVELWGGEPQLNDPSERYWISSRLFTVDGQPIARDQCLVARSLQEGRSLSDESLYFERPDRSRRLVRISCSPYFGDEGQLLGAMNVVVDLADRTPCDHELGRRAWELADFFDNGSLALHWVGPDGIIIRANRAELDLLGYSAEEYIGRHIAEFHADPQTIADILRRLAAGEELHDYEARLRCKDGSIKDVVISSNVLWEDGRFVHTRCFTSDVTSRKRTEKELQEREVWLSGQGEALESALNGAPLSTSLGVLVRTTTELLGPAVRAAFYLANPAGTALHHVVGMPEGYARAVDGFHIGPDSLACGLATHTGQAIFSSDVIEEPLWERWRWLAEEYDFRGCWSIPIHTSSQRYVGTLAIYWRQPRVASSREKEFAAMVTQAAAIIISRHREAEDRRLAEEARREQAERLRLLWEAAAMLLTADDPDAMLRGLLAQIGPHLGVDVYFNYLVNDSGDALRLASCEGIPDAAVGNVTRVEFGESICGAVALHRQPIVASHIQQADDPQAQLVKSLGIRAYACNPLMADSALLGTLSFASRTKDQFDPGEIAFLETISHYVTVAYERLRLLKELQETDRRKDEFLATLAHELRNPLAPVRNAVQLLRLKGSDQPELRWSHDVIERQVDHLTRLIEDLLDISRITRNKLELRTQRVELAEIITGAVEASRPNIEQHGHELTITLPAQPVYIQGDIVRLAQAFLNLLNNAAKYTERGGRIWLTAERREQDVVVSVKDTGVGIPREKLPCLFQMFFQVDRSLEKAQSGLGIGLSLVRRLVELHGGQVEARSDGAGQGSEFIVRLPVLADDVPPVPAEAAGIGDGEPLRGHRILVVDDNRDSADSLAMLLRLYGCEVHVAYDGLSGVEACERLKPSAILLDIGMPGLNGYEVCRRIRAQWPDDGLVMVALTGWGQEEDRSRSAEAGFDAHLVKPVQLSALTELLASRAPRASCQPAC